MWPAGILEIFPRFIMAKNTVNCQHRIPLVKLSLCFSSFYNGWQDCCCTKPFKFFFAAPEGLFSVVIAAGNPMVSSSGGHSPDVHWDTLLSDWLRKPLPRIWDVVLSVRHDAPPRSKCLQPRILSSQQPGRRGGNHGIGRTTWSHDLSKVHRSSKLKRRHWTVKQTPGWVFNFMISDCCVGIYLA